MDLRQLTTKGNDAVEILENDHTVIKQLLDGLMRATEINARKQVLDRLKMVLVVHNATEENLVYPALEKLAGEKAEAEHLYHATAEADVLVFDLDTMLKSSDDKDFGSKAKKLRDAVHEHIDDEEQSAFPRLRQNAHAEELEMLTTAVREFRKALRFQPSSV